MSPHGWLRTFEQTPARLLVAGVLLLLQAVPPFAQSSEQLQLVQTIALPDVLGRIDHLDIDLDGSRLFVAALGNNSVEVIDLRAGRRIARVGQLHEPQGVAYFPGERRLFVASGGSGRVDAFEGTGLAAVGRIDGLADADNLRYEQAGGRLYVGYGAALAVVDVRTMQVINRIKLAGHPESFQLDSPRSRIFINVPNAHQIAVVDSKRGSAVATWDLGEMQSNFPMAFDEGKQRLFVGTRRPASLLVYDTGTGKRIANVPIGGDVDDIFFDDQRKRVYAICGEGVITVVQQQDADRYAAIGQVRTAPGTRTGLFVPTRGALYVAVPAQGATSAEIRVYNVK